MGRKMKIALIALSVCLLASSFAFAEKGQSEKCGMMMQGIYSKMKGQDKVDLEDKFFDKAYLIYMNSDELGITEAQMQEVTALKLKVKKGLLMKEAEIDGLVLDLMDALSKDEVDMKAVNGLLDKKYEAKKQKAKELAQAYADLRMTLTKDQRKKLKDAWHKSMSIKMKKIMEDECDDGYARCPVMMKTKTDKEMKKRSR